MKRIVICIVCLSALWVVSSCEEVSDTPEVNEGYTTNYRMPDPEFLTDEDRAFIEAQEAEYKQNAK